MPIYEYLCRHCHRVFSFLVRSPGTAKEPRCPRCGRGDMERRFSRFATPRRAARSGRAAPASGGEEGADRPSGPDLDDPRVEREMMRLMSQMEHLDENDPRSMAQVMRKLSDITGEPLGPGMQEAIRRMEAGEDPEKVEEDLGEELAEETDGLLGEGGAKGEPTYDDGLYEL